MPIIIRTLQRTVPPMILLFVSFASLAQGRSMLNFDANITPSAETYTMIKYCLNKTFYE